MFYFPLEVDHFPYCFDFIKFTTDTAHCQCLKRLVFAFPAAMTIKLYGSLNISLWMFLNIYSSLSNLLVMIYTICNI